jgi:hypothetical protein
MGKSATTPLGSLCRMNLAVRGIDADIKWNNEGSRSCVTTPSPR